MNTLQENSQSCDANEWGTIVTVNTAVSLGVRIINMMQVKEMSLRSITNTHELIAAGLLTELKL